MNGRARQAGSAHQLRQREPARAVEGVKQQRYPIDDSARVADSAVMVVMVPSHGVGVSVTYDY